MDLQAAAFYILSGIAILAALAVISARNPVHSVLFLILAFVAGAGLFVLIGAEYLAMLLVVVYVGAVAVLFLFVVMMLDVNFAQLKRGFWRYLPIGGLVAALLVGQLLLIANLLIDDRPANIRKLPEGADNARALGAVLYDDYLALFQLSGLVLLVAMVGAVVLTLRHRVGVKRQDVGRQVARTRKQGVELIDITPGKGLG